MGNLNQSWGDAELRHLRTFIAVAEAQSFSRAAERLESTQPGVSQHIQQLERILGVGLVARMGRRITLTPAGRQFHGEAAEVLRRMELACQSLAGPLGEERGNLRVGVVPICNASLMPLILKHFHGLHPGFTINVNEVSALDIERDIEMGRLDVGVGFLPHASPTLRYQKLLKEKFSLLVRHDHPLAEHGRIPMSSLQRMEMALLPRSFFMRHLIDKIIIQHRLRPRIVFEINSIPTLIATVAQSGLATLMLPFSLRMGLGSSLKSIELVGHQPFIELGIIRPPQKEANPPVEAFCQIALNVIQQPV